MGNDWLKKCVGLSLLVIAVSVAYYFVIFLPRERTARLEMDQQEKRAAEQREREKLDILRQEKLATEQRERDRSELLDACLADAFANYDDRWRKSCRSRGLAENCELPLVVGQDYDKDHNNARADCFKRYPQR